jgi:AAA domain (dynein-related subfamily)
MSTVTFSTKVITFEVHNDTGSIEQVAIYLRKDEDAANFDTKVFIRSAARWESLTVPASLWPTIKSSKRAGFIGTLQGHLGKKIKGGPFQLLGVWEVDVTDEDAAELQAGLGGATPRILFDRVEATFKEIAPITYRKDTVDDIATWFTDGPLLALADGFGLEAWTTSPLNAVVTPVPVIAAQSEYTLSNGDVFYSRPLWKANGVEISDVSYIQMQAKRQKTVLLVGPGGTGKTSLLEASSDRLFVSLGHAEMTMQSLYGRYEVDGGNGFKWVRAELINSIQYAQDHPEERVTWLLDEAMQVPEEVQIHMHPLLDHRRCLVIEEGPDKGTLHAPENWSMVAASNPNEPGARLGRPFASRLLPIHYHTNWAVVAKIVGPGFEQLLTLAQAMNLMYHSGDIEWAPQTRHIKETVKEMQFMGVEYGLAMLMNMCDAETGFSDAHEVEELQRQIVDTYGVSNLKRLIVT